MRILITRTIASQAVEKLAREGYDVDYRDSDEAMSRDQLLARIAPCEVALVTLTERIDAAVLDTAPNLRLIANFGAGYNNVDMEAAKARNIAVTNTPDVLTETTADLTWALILAVARRLGEAERLLRAGEWTGWGTMQFLGHDIHGATLGVVGSGRIGTAVAKRASGFGMRVLYTPSRRTGPISSMGECAELSTILRESDFVSLHVYLGASTHHLIGAEQLALMKSTAYLINTARGPVVDEVALVDALREGRIAGAGLDVFEEEPNVHPGLLELDNVVLLPHIGSATVETRTKMALLAADNAIAFLQGRPLLTAVS